MITLFRTDKKYTFTELRTKVRDLIRSLPRNVSFIGDPIKVLRYEFLCEPIVPLIWLHNQKAKEKIFWSNRDASFAVAGIGVADSISGHEKRDFQDVFARMEDRFSADNPKLRYYGGFSFDHLITDPVWKKLSSYYFVIPRFEFYQKGEEFSFVLNIALKDICEEKINQILDEFEKIDFSLETTFRNIPQILSRADFPNQKSWQDIFAQANKVENKIEKVVLARKSEFEFDVNIRPSALIKHLKDKTPQCYHFCFQVDKYLAFLGASPERLYFRKENFIESEAIAGTVARGKNTTVDTELAEELKESTKNILEHRFVVEAIEQALAPLCKEINKDQQASILKLKEAQHLLTRFTGILDQKVTNAQILAALHPTPAVAGTPSQKAIQLIKNLEPFDRGWYAAPVGYVGYEHCEFAVGIRSGMVNQNVLSLFAGAGIVEGSTALGEWDEIENKISRFMKVFQS